MNKTKANGKNTKTKSNISKNCNGMKMVFKLIRTGVIRRVTQIRIRINGSNLSSGNNANRRKMVLKLTSSKGSHEHVFNGNSKNSNGNK